MPRKTRMRKSRKQNRKTVRRRNRKIRGGATDTVNIYNVRSIQSLVGRTLTTIFISDADGDYYKLYNGDNYVGSTEPDEDMPSHIKISSYRQVSGGYNITYEYNK